MIRVHITPTHIHVEGHAGYAPHGQDIVCAGVSALVVTLERSLSELTKDDIKCDIQPGRAVIEYRQLSKAARLLVSAFFIGINGIAESYPGNVEVKQEGNFVGPCNGNAMGPLLRDGCSGHKDAVD